MSLKVVITDNVFDSVDPQREVLSRTGADLIVGDCKTVAHVVALAHDADALMNTYFAPVGAEVMDGLTKCRVIVRYGIGVDTIDIPAATAHGIMVANVPGFCLEEVSDHAMALLLALARRLGVYIAGTRAGRWQVMEGRPMYRLRGSTLGLIGFGQIPRTLVPKAKAFGIHIVAHDPYVPADVVREHGAEPVTMDVLLARSDYVSVHAPSTPDTHHMVNADVLAKMKPRAVLVNTARAALVDTAALVEALRNKQIAGAGLDMIEDDKSYGAGHPLADMDNVILTPHAAFLSEESLFDLQTTAAEEVARVLEGGVPKSWLNPEVGETKRYMSLRDCDT